MSNTVGDYAGKRISWSTRKLDVANENMVRRLVDNALATSSTSKTGAQNGSVQAGQHASPSVLAGQHASPQGATNEQSDHHQGQQGAAASSSSDNIFASAIDTTHQHQLSNFAPRESSENSLKANSCSIPPLFSDEKKTAKQLHKKRTNATADETRNEKKASALSSNSSRKSKSSVTSSSGAPSENSNSTGKAPAKRQANSIVLKAAAAEPSLSNPAADTCTTSSAETDASFVDSVHQSLVHAEMGSESLNMMMMYGNTNSILNSSTMKTATSASALGPIPRQLKGTFTNDYNLIEANAVVLSKFEMTRRKERPNWERRLSDIENALQTRSMRIVERKALERECDSIRDNIAQCSEDLERQYRAEVEPLLARYQELGPRVRIIRFSKNTKDITPAGQDKERMELIESYLEICRKYIDVQLTRVLPNDRNCTNCNLSGSELAVDDEGVSCCPRCGLERLFAYNCPVPIEELPSSRSEYEDRKNLYKALMRYQGKQPNKLPSTLENDLDEYFRSFGLPTGNQVRQAPLNAKGNRGNTSLQLMFRALSETGHAEHYENCNLICAQYWGWLLPDVSHLEDIIMADYDATQAVYERMVRKRKSSINTQFRLFKHLQARGHVCSLSDFKVVTTPDILAALEEMWREMVEGAKVEGLRYIPTL